MITPTPAQAAPDPLTKLQTLERELLAILLEREEVIRAALVALVAREHLIQLGAPGAAKTRLMTELAKRLQTAQGAGVRCFAYLLTRFTTPEELFGPLSLAGLKRDEYRRLTAGRLVEAELVLLDEVFKAGSAILNTLLGVLQERVFANGGPPAPVPLLTLFGASNELPTQPELAALWDRFLLRVPVEYLSESGFAQFLQGLAQRPTAAAVTAAQKIRLPASTLTLAELTQLQSAAAQLPVPEMICAALGQLRRELQTQGICLSDRRWGQCLPVLRAHALLEGRAAVGEDDLPILKHCLWQTLAQRPEALRLLARAGNPLNAKAVELGDQAVSVYQACLAAQQDAESEEQKLQAAIEANTKLKQLTHQWQELAQQAHAQGRSLQRLEHVGQELARLKGEVAALILY
jgi:MoxR-like ATPase